VRGERTRAADFYIADTDRPITSTARSRIMAVRCSTDRLLLTDRCPHVPGHGTDRVRIRLRARRPRPRFAPSPYRRVGDRLDDWFRNSDRRTSARWIRCGNRLVVCTRKRIPDHFRVLGQRHQPDLVPGIVSRHCDADDAASPLPFLDPPMTTICTPPEWRIQSGRRGKFPGTKRESWMAFG
jgi:hypothetical protein